MPRKIFVLGILVMAAALGVLGYQFLTHIIYGAWPAVSVSFVWRTLFGDGPTLHESWPRALSQWIGNLPLVGFGIAISYIVLLLSDLTRGRAGRSPR